jgi:biotin carboxylase
MRQYAVVVDPLGTGQEYPEAFREAGVEVVAVLTAAEPIELYRDSWHPENFRHVHVFDGDLGALAYRLRTYRPICVIAGSETGVELADVLVELVLPGSGHVPPLGPARRDKWAMARAVESAGIPHLRQTCSSDPDQIDQWLRDTGLDARPIVVKPPKSAATDDVHLVATGKEWRPLYDEIYGKVNEFGVRNDAILVQEYAEGPELVVDSYSVDGKHGLVDVCRYTKVQRGDRIGIYDLVDLVPPDHPDTRAVWPYAERVLDAVGIRNGPCHTELILTADGPRLLEVGARPAGGDHQRIIRLATGSNQILRTVAHRVHGVFEDGYRWQQHACRVVITAPYAGVWRNAEVFSGVPELPTFQAQHFGYRTGDVVPAPGSMATFLGWVVLAGTDGAAVAADYRRIKDWEEQILVDPA